MPDYACQHACICTRPASTTWPLGSRGAYLIATSGTFAASNEKRAARLAFFAACVCCVLTFTGILGSSPRVGKD